MKTMKLKELGRGSLFAYGGIEWAVLDHAKGCELCISADIMEKRAFDTENRNDFAASTLRAWLNGEFFDNLLKNGAEKNAFEDLNLDLTSDDGLEDYGTDRATIGLITCGMYRKFRRFIPNVNEWWWTCTPWSTKSGADDDGNLVRLVDTSGALSDGGAYHGGSGVRPLCILKSDILVSVEDGEDKPREGIPLLDVMLEGLREAVTDAVNDAGGAEKMAKGGGQIDVTLNVVQDDDSKDEGDNDEEPHATFEDVRTGMMDCMKHAQEQFTGTWGDKERRKSLKSLAETYLMLCSAEKANREAGA